MKVGIFLGIFVLAVAWVGTAFGDSSPGFLLPATPLKGWTLTEGPRHYNRKTLFEHIDGQAELYLKYGYQRSVFGMYQHEERPEEQIEIDVYEMGSVLQAFGIFSRLRIEGRSGGVGLGSSMDDRSLLFYKGKHFVILDATVASLPALKELALLVSAGIADSSPPPREILLFPQKNLKPESIQYFSEGLLGHRFLKRGFQGTYVGKEEAGAKAKVKVEAQVGAEAETGKEEKEFHLVLAILKDRGETKNALSSYREYLVKKGKIRSEIPTGLGPDALAGEDPYHGKVVIVPKGSYLVGVAGFQNEEEALGCLTEAIERLK